MIRKTLTLDLPAEQLAGLTRPAEVPLGATVTLEATTGGSQRDPTITGVRLEWSWEIVSASTAAPSNCPHCGAYWIPYTGIGDAKQQRQHAVNCPTHAGLSDALGLELR